MPDIVNDDDLSALAAEYVLGTLDANERTRANVLLDVDHQFLSKVRIWERRLGELHLMVEPVEPEARIWQRIRGKLKNVAPIAAAAAPVPASPSAPKIPSGVPFPAPVEPKPPAATTAHKLAGLMQEVEKLTADSKAADPKGADSKATDPKAAEHKATDHKPADSKPGEQKIVEVEPAEPTLAPLAEPQPNAADVAWASSPVAVAEPEGPAQQAPASAPAEVGPPDAPAAVLEPRPTVAELAAKLAPDPAATLADEPRTVDRVRRETAGAHLADAPRKMQAARLAMDRAARPARVGLWRSIAALMLLVSVALGSLIASWRYIPERLPAGLRASAVLNLSEVTSSLPRKSGVIGAQFDE